jgi:Protein of unknown function (DUF3455)
MMHHRLPCAVLAWLVATAAGTLADEPLVPAPPGARLLLEAAGQGVQVYDCEKAGDAYHWVFKAPDAALFDATGRQIGTHFAGPSWQLADGSKIVGEVVAQATAPEPHAIAWLLLRVKSHAGNGGLSGIDLVRRVDTHGGTPPAASCDATQAQTEARMRYTASYLFYAAPR